MVPKKRKVAGKKSIRKSHSKSFHSAGMTQLQKRAFLTFALFVFMFYGLTQVSVTSPISAKQNVLGEDDEHEDNNQVRQEEEKREEEKRDEKKEEKREERKQEVRKLEDRDESARPVGELERRQKEDRLQKARSPINIQNNSEESKEPEKSKENEIESDLEVQKEKSEIIKRNEVEIRTQDGKKIKTKVEDDGSKKIEIEGKDFKLKYEIHNGKFEARAEDENGESVDIPDDASAQLEDSIESELEEEGIEVDKSSSQPSIVKNGVRARSAFPLAINPVTKVLTVTTPNGEKDVAILPDEAMRRLKETGLVDEFEVSKDGKASEETEFALHNDKMTYKIKGKKHHRLLGFIPVKTNATSYVSAETGEPLEIEQSLFASLIDSISF